MNETTTTLDLDKEYILSKAIPAFPICGIYFLIKDDEIVYVGQSRRMSLRVSQHRGIKDFDRLFYVECQENELDALENQYILKFSPRLNKNSGRHIVSYDVEEDCDKREITPQDFQMIEERYRAALQARSEMIQKQHRSGWTQKQIAEYWKLDTSRVNRIIKRNHPGGNRGGS